MNTTATRTPGVAAPRLAVRRTTAVSHLPKLQPDELSFLLGLLACPGGTPPPAFPARGDPGLLWEYIERHGIGGVLGCHAEAVPGLPPALAEAAQHRYWSNCLHSQRARQTCAVVVEAGRQAGVPVFFVKGPALADQGYADDGLRGFSDLDVFTGSAEDARRLVRGCDARVLIDSERQNFWTEIGDSGRVVAELDGTSLEIRFPVAGWSGPLFDMFPEGRLPALVRTANGLPAPNAEWHFLFLLHHLMMHHFFGRYIWFLDLAVLMKRERANMDWGRILEESKRLAMREGLAAAANFCRRHVDAGFPEAPPLLYPAWNRPFIHQLVHPEVIAASEKNKQQVSCARRGMMVWYGIASYFLLADAPAKGLLCNGRGGLWLTARVGNVLARRWRGKFGRWVAGWSSSAARWLVYPLARFLAWTVIRQKPQ